MHLSLLPLSPVAEELYKSHTTFHDGDSGLDLFIIEDQVIKAGETAYIKLGFKAAAHTDEGKPVSYLLFARSSISKSPIRLCNSVGLIDAGYRGELMAPVDNIKNFDFEVKKGERYFQLVSFNGEKISLSIVNELDKTTRGEGGFGSTDLLDSAKGIPQKIAKIDTENTENLSKNVQ
ncbi:deoxyuridinetriphosphatase [Cryptosporidium sp. chipmunk genotype I]|uniref:deoxyuridinetriphosphatase n=1 Tax=Cryptosporidium sp. chipmunk genotype I TaxID=1280935 RepID=UPI00351A6CCB|nr:deoxyuridinetriphosphatase [Cryptosporidium sp. chipmunk genotype I]